MLFTQLCFRSNVLPLAKLASLSGEPLKRWHGCRWFYAVTSLTPVKLVFSEVHGCTSLNERRSRCAAYLQKFP